MYLLFREYIVGVRTFFGFSNNVDASNVNDLTDALVVFEERDDFDVLDYVEPGDFIMDANGDFCFLLLVLAYFISDPRRDDTLGLLAVVSLIIPVMKISLPVCA